MSTPSRLAFRFLLLGLLALPAPAQGWFGGAQVHWVVPMDQPRPSLSQDLNHHTGGGIGLLGGYQFDERHELRGFATFTGIRVANWTEADAYYGDERLNDTWRALRFGLEHEVRLFGDPEGRHLAFFYGGGLQETWVNRHTGSWLETSLLVLFASSGTYASGTVIQDTRRTLLDSWRPFASAGLTLRLSPTTALSMRWLAGSYLRDRTYGLRTTGSSVSELRLGSQVELGLAFRSEPR